jgi:hypothetical protein
MNPKYSALCFAMMAPLAYAQTLYPAATGQMHCADKVMVAITENKLPHHHYEIDIDKVKYQALRVVTDSGAVKLEDKRHGIVWLQMSNKSMLFDEKRGKRLATDCRTEEQKVVQKAMDTPITTVATSKP